MPERISPSAYPLQWPAGWPRTPIREKWPAQVTLSAALNNLTKEARLLGVTSMVLSSNCSLGMENAPDPGVVMYGFYEKQQLAIPCDRWNTVAGNCRAIARTIEAMRGMERWGAKQMIRAMFQGFTALPAPDGSKRHWSDVLGINASGRVSRAIIELKWRDLASQHHPDRPGGSALRMSEINVARDEALQEIKK